MQTDNNMANIVVFSSHKADFFAVRSLLSELKTLQPKVKYVANIELLLPRIIKGRLDVLVVQGELLGTRPKRITLQWLCNIKDILIVVLARDPSTLNLDLDESHIWLNLDDPQSVQKVKEHIVNAVSNKQLHTYSGLRERRYEELFNEAPVMYVITRNYNGVPIIVDHNKLFASKLGYESGEIIGKPLDKFYTPCSRQKLYEEGGYQRALKGTFKLEERELVTKDGRVVYTLLQAMPEYGHKYRVIGTRAVFVDVTDRKEMENELRKLSYVVEQTADHVMITSKNGKIEYINPAFERQTGYTREETIGQRASILKSGKHSPEFYRNLWKTILAGKVFRDVIINKKKNGELFYEEKTITPIKNQKGEIIYFVSTGKDITERVKMEERLRKMERLEAIGNLAAGLAHDFNHILSIIIGISESLMEEVGDIEELRKELAQILSAAKSGSNLIRQLLAFSRKQVLNPRYFELNIWLSQKKDLLQRILPKNIRLHIEFYPEDIFVYLDPGQVDQIILNLVFNARDAMPDGGTIYIQLSAVEIKENDASRPNAAEIHPGNYAVLRIVDTGIGMDEETREKIFEPFFSRKESDRGTGLGLATVYGIVKQSKGYIFCDSAPGQGTTFEIYLPRVIGKVTVPHDNQEKPESRPENLVLVVDDNEIVRRVISKALTRKGYKVKTAASGQEAIRMIQDLNDIHLLISDVSLLDSSGPEIARIAKEHFPRLKIIYMSGYGHDILGENGLQDERIEFLQKPFTSTELCDKVESMLHYEDPSEQE